MKFLFKSDKLTASARSRFSWFTRSLYLRCDAKGTASIWMKRHRGRDPGNPYRRALKLWYQPNWCCFHSPIYISLRKLHTCARSFARYTYSKWDSARSCAPGYPMRSWRATWLPIGGSSNFANVILSVISGLMLVSDFGSSKITANHFAVEFLSRLVFPVSLTLCRFSCTSCIDVHLYSVNHPNDVRSLQSNWLTVNSLAGARLTSLLNHYWYFVNEFHRLRDTNKVTGLIPELLL